MVEKTHTPEQINNAQRLCDVIESAPSEKRPELMRLVEAMVMGVELADRLQQTGTQGS